MIQREGTPEICGCDGTGACCGYVTLDTNQRINGIKRFSQRVIFEDGIEGDIEADTLGSATIGSNTTPIYLDEGSPVACTGVVDLTTAGQIISGQKYLMSINNVILGRTPPAGETPYALPNITWITDTSGSLNNLVHTSGNETIGGSKTFSNTIIIQSNAEQGYDIRRTDTVRTDGWHRTRWDKVYDSNWSLCSQILATANGGTIDTRLSSFTPNGAEGFVGAVALSNELVYGIAPTPTSSVLDTNAIATIGYVSDTGGSLNNLVHTNGNETISGLKTIQENTDYLNPSFTAQSTAPTALAVRDINFKNSGGEYLGCIRFQQNADGSQAFYAGIWSFANNQ